MEDRIATLEAVAAILGAWAVVSSLLLGWAVLSVRAAARRVERLAAEIDERPKFAVPAGPPRTRTMWDSMPSSPGGR